MAKWAWKMVEGEVSGEREGKGKEVKLVVWTSWRNLSEGDEGLR